MRTSAFVFGALLGVSTSAAADQYVVDGKVFWYAPLRQAGTLPTGKETGRLLVTIQEDGKPPVVVDDPAHTYAAAWPVGTPEYQALVTTVAAAAATGGHITLTLYPGLDHVNSSCGPNPYSGTYYPQFGSLNPVSMSGPVNVYGPDVNPNSP